MKKEKQKRKRIKGEKNIKVIKGRYEKKICMIMLVKKARQQRKKRKRLRKGKISLKGYGGRICKEGARQYIIFLWPCQ